MQLNGIGASTVNFKNSSSPNQVDSTKVKQLVEEGVKQQQVSKTEEKRHLEQKKYTKDEILDNVEKANKMVAVYDRRFEISIHDKTKQVMVKVIDSTTDEVIREIPSEKMLDMVAGFMEIAGIIVDKRI